LKRVLITGANSYVGTNVEKWLMRNPDKYTVDTLNMKDQSWKNFDFSKFDVVFHVAGVAHVSTKKSMQDLYFKVNRDLAIETAQKAKSSGVKQFIFMSSMIVYNSKESVITHETKPDPDNFYGLSKLQAEDRISKLECLSFKVCILRPPMIYGKHCKGNYLKLSKLSIKIKLFPNISNYRSMLYIDNLSELVKLIIDNEDMGIFFPQNKNQISTSELVKLISNANKKKIYLFSGLNWIIKLMNKIRIVRKIFGNFAYAKEISIYEHGEYQIYDFHESIMIIEGVKNGN